MWSPEMISGPSLYFRAAPYATAGMTAVAGRAGGGRDSRQGTALAQAAGGGGGGEEEEHGQRGTVRAVPGALRGGQPGVAAPPRRRLILTTVSVCVCSGGRVRFPREAAPSHRQPRQAPRSQLRAGLR